MKGSRASLRARTSLNKYLVDSSSSDPEYNFGGVESRIRERQFGQNRATETSFRWGITKQLAVNTCEDTLDKPHSWDPKLANNGLLHPLRAHV
jgi:hypothetical protein